MKNLMQRLFLGVFALFLAFALPVQEAEAKRFGGGKSSGMQRDFSSQRQATPQRSPDTPANQAVNPAGKRSWLGPVAGLAAGLGLAALASHFGFGEEMANFLLIALLVMAGIFLFKWLTRSRTAPQHGMQYASAGNTPGSMPSATSALPMGSATSAPLPNAGVSFPAGFDAEAFVRQAKLNFLRLQAAYDAANLNDIREFTSPEMFAEIKLQLEERNASSQRTDVLNLHADVLECAEEGSRHVVSVRFHGLIREDLDGPANDFDEVWHLSKEAQGSHGWVVAGIQQYASPS